MDLCGEGGEYWSTLYLGNLSLNAWTRKGFAQLNLLEHVSCRCLSVYSIKRNIYVINIWRGGGFVWRGEHISTFTAKYLQVQTLKFHILPFAIYES